MLVIGGDLAYPNPSNETYETRFFRPYEAAFPPPPHVHSGRLVVSKPDLPIHMNAMQHCSVGQNACPQHSDLDASKHSGETNCRYTLTPSFGQDRCLRVSFPDLLQFLYDSSLQLVCRFA